MDIDKILLIVILVITVLLSTCIFLLRNCSNMFSYKVKGGDKILLFGNDGESTFPIEVPIDGTIGDLEDAIEKQKHIKNVVLNFQGKTLSDKHMLIADSGLSSEAMVDVLVQPPLLMFKSDGLVPGVLIDRSSSRFFHLRDNQRTREYKEDRRNFEPFRERAKTMPVNRGFRHKLLPDEVRDFVCVYYNSQILGGISYWILLGNDGQYHTYTIVASNPVDQGFSTPNVEKKIPLYMYDKGVTADDKGEIFPPNVEPHVVTDQSVLQDIFEYYKKRQPQ